MKRINRIALVICMALTFSLPAFAGDMETTVVPPPPPAEKVTTNGDMETTFKEEEDPNVVEVVANIVKVLLSLF
jgi:hypothetical protein